MKAILLVVVVSQSRWGTLIGPLCDPEKLSGTLIGRVFLCVFTAIAAILLVGVRTVQNKVCFQRAVEARSLAVAVLQGRRDTLLVYLSLPVVFVPELLGHSLVDHGHCCCVPDPCL